MLAKTIVRDILNIFEEYNIITNEHVTTDSRILMYEVIKTIDQAKDAVQEEANGERLPHVFLSGASDDNYSTKLASILYHYTNSLRLKRFSHQYIDFLLTTIFIYINVYFAKDTLSSDWDIALFYDNAEHWGIVGQQKPLAN